MKIKSLVLGAALGFSSFGANADLVVYGTNITCHDLINGSDTFTAREMFSYSLGIANGLNIAAHHFNQPWLSSSPEEYLLEVVSICESDVQNSLWLASIEAYFSLVK